MGRLQNNPSIGWVHPKSTHAGPLAWGNNKGNKKATMKLKIVPTHLVTKVKPTITSVEVHPQLSNNGHPVDDGV
jgi:hypothetical protein